MLFHLTTFRKSLCTGIMLFFQLALLWAVPANPSEKCPLPPPDKLWITSITSTSISVEWTVVPNAQMYQVELIDLSTGLTVATLLTQEVEATFGGLTPGTWYRVNVRASSCEDGPFGNAIKIDGQTSIIIVDVIIQQQCPVSGKAMNWPTNTKQFNLLMNGLEVYHIKLTDPTLGATFDFVTEAQNNELRVDTKAAIGCFLVTNDSTVEVYYNNSSPSSNPVFMRMKIMDCLSPDMIFEVEKSSTAMVSEAYCSSTPGGRQRSEQLVLQVPVADWLVAPNPVSDYISVQGALLTAGKSAQCTLLDASGRIWRSLEIHQDNFILPAQDLPPGVYFLRLQSEQFSAVKKLIKNP